MRCRHEFEIFLLPLQLESCLLSKVVGPVDSVQAEVAKEQVGVGEYVPDQTECCLNICSIHSLHCFLVLSIMTVCWAFHGFSPIIPAAISFLLQ